MGMERWFGPSDIVRRSLQRGYIPGMFALFRSSVLSMVIGSFADEPFWKLVVDTSSS